MGLFLYYSHYLGFWLEWLHNVGWLPGSVHSGIMEVLIPIQACDQHEMLHAVLGERVGVSAPMLLYNYINYYILCWLILSLLCLLSLRRGRFLRSE